MALNRIWYCFLPGLLNMSLTASIVIGIVLVARVFLRRMPRIYSYMLWSVVLFRLVCPVSFSLPISAFSLTSPENVQQGVVTYIPSDIVYERNPQITLPMEPVTGPIENSVNASLPKAEEAYSVNPMQVIVSIGNWVWLLGVLVLGMMSIISASKLRKRMVGAVKLRDNIWLVDSLGTAFVSGLMHPRIYLDSALSTREQEFVITHEQTHIRRRDYLVKPVAWLVLMAHWFNPLVWLSFFLCMKDMEMSCDESVLRHTGEDIRTDYSRTLLNLAAGRDVFAGTPLFFGEGDTKSRIRNILNYHKRAVWIGGAGAVAVAVLIVVLAANPLMEDDAPHAEETGENVTKAEIPTENKVEEMTGGITEGITEASIPSRVEIYRYSAAGQLTDGVCVVEKSALTDIWNQCNSITLGREVQLETAREGYGYAFYFYDANGNAFEDKASWVIWDNYCMVNGLPSVYECTALKDGTIDKSRVDGLMDTYWDNPASNGGATPWYTGETYPERSSSIMDAAMKWIEDYNRNLTDGTYIDAETMHNLSLNGFGFQAEFLGDFIKRPMGSGLDYTKKYFISFDKEEGISEIVEESIGGQENISSQDMEEFRNLIKLRNEYEMFLAGLEGSDWGVEKTMQNVPYEGRQWMGFPADEQIVRAKLEQLFTKEDVENVLNHVCFRGDDGNLYKADLGMVTHISGENTIYSVRKNGEQIIVSCLVAGGVYPVETKYDTSRDYTFVPTGNGWRMKLQMYLQ